MAASGIYALAALTSLTELAISCCPALDIGCCSLRALPRLVALDLRGSFIGFDEDGEASRFGALGWPTTCAVARLTGLTRLALRAAGLQVADATALACNLHVLAQLEVGGSCLGDAGVVKLAGMTALEQLGLRAVGVGDAGVGALTRLIALKDLDLGLNDVGNVGARAVARLTWLTRLQLSRLGWVGDAQGEQVRHLVSTRGAQALARLSRLVHLDLDGQCAGVQGACALARLTGLRSLRLTANDIGDEGGCALACALTVLTYLSLARNQLEASAAKAIAKLPLLVELHLPYNFLRCEGVCALAAMTRLQRLSLEGCGRIGKAGRRALTRRHERMPHIGLPFCSRAHPASVMGTGGHRVCTKRGGCRTTAGMRFRLLSPRHNAWATAHGLGSFADCTLECNRHSLQNNELSSKC